MSDEQKNGDEPQDPGGVGGDADEYPLIGKTKVSRLERMAIHQRFPISEKEARAVIARQIKDAIDPGNTPRECNSAARAVFQAMAINQADEHKQQPGELNINLGTGIRIIEDRNWYGNFDRLLPSPLQHQIKILMDPARFKVVVAGRRWGKTGTALQAAVRSHGCQSFAPSKSE